MKMDRLKRLRNKLVGDGYDRLRRSPSLNEFTGIAEADELLNDIKGQPHAFVLACIMDRQMKAEKAWQIPYELKKRLGFFDFEKLAALSLSSPKKMEKAMHKPTPLHRFPNQMCKNMIGAIHHISTKYGGNASKIWKGKPSSSTIVRRFLEFHGVGQKIATMAANILVRDFRVDVSDRYSIDISVDIQIKRVFSRMGFVSPDASNELMVFRARELNPEYPGVFDLVLWELGRNTCRERNPHCKQCPYARQCKFKCEGDNH